MNVNSYTTPTPKAADCKKNWLLLDARGQVLGRIASRIAHHLRGKHKAFYAPHLDCGDHIVVINADAIRLTGKKWNDKAYIRHTGYPGGQRTAFAHQVFEKNPTRLLESAVRGMLPKNRLGRKQFRNCYLYAGEQHPHEAQQPQPLDLSAS